MKALRYLVASPFVLLFGISSYINEFLYNAVELIGGEDLGDKVLDWILGEE